MDRKPLQIAGLLLAVLACVLAVLALSRDSRPAAAAAAPLDPGAIQVQELANRVAELRVDLDRVASASQPSLEARAPRESLAPGVPPELLERLAALEQSVAALQKLEQERPALRPKPAGGAPDPTDAQQAATDPRSSEKDRLAALAALRGQKVDGQDARSHDVILALLDVAEHSQSEGSRLDVYRNMHGVTDLALRDSMLRALAGDPSVKVRLKVAQDLDTFLADALVVAGLRQAADGDADAAVRAQALMTLAGKR
jgi:hypothetical protein